MSAFPIPDPEVLLREGDFVRGLARRLLRDADDAEDVAQEAWVRRLASSERPRHPRRFLARVVRNLAHNHRRLAMRRRRREEGSARSGSEPSAAEVVAREELRRRVVEAVLALEEPFRSAILLRFYEGLAPAAIARRLGVPAATTRTRIARGLQRLRARLDDAHDGEHRAWMAGLASLAASPAPWWTTAGGAGKKGLLAAAALGLAVTVGVLARLEPAADVFERESDALGAAHAAADASRESRRDDADAGGRRDAARRALAATPESPRVYPAERPDGILAGLVLDARQQPVGGATVEAGPHTGKLPRGMVLHDDRSTPPPTVTAADGTFRIEPVPAGPWRVTATLDGRRARVVAIAGEHPSDAVLELPDEKVDSRRAVRVVDARGRAVPGASVEVLGSGGTVDAGRTDGDGRLSVDLPRRASVLVFARSEDAIGMASVDGLRSAGRETRLVVDRPGIVQGVLRFPSIETLGDVAVILHGRTSHHPLYHSHGRTFHATVRGNRYRVEGLPAGTYSIEVRSRAGLRLASEPFRWGDTPLENSVAASTVEVTAGTVTARDLDLVAGGILEGRVLHGDDAPVAGARVRTVLAPLTSNFSEGFRLHGTHVWRLDSRSSAPSLHPASSTTTTTDATGRYRIAGLPPGEHRVEVVAVGWSYDRRESVELRDGHTTTLEHRLERDGVLQAALATGSYVGVIRQGEEQPAAIAIVPTGASWGASVFTFPGLRPGRYRIGRFHSDARVAFRQVGEAVVRAGRTTWVDLTAGEAPECVISGTVSDAHGPVAGAVLRLGTQTARTARDGAFRLELGHRLWGHLGSDRIVVHHEGDETTLELPAETRDVVRWHGSLQLGRAQLSVATRRRDGSPAPARVSVQSGGRNPDGWTGTHSGTRATGADGLATFETLLAGETSVHVVFESGVEARTETRLPAAEPVVVVEPSHGILDVDVRDQRGHPVAERKLFVWTWGGDGPPPADPGAFVAGASAWRTSATGPDGRVRVRGVHAGTVMVVLRPLVPLAPFDPAAARTVELRPGATAAVRIP